MIVREDNFLGEYRLGTFDVLIIAANTKSHLLYLCLFDLAEKIKEADCANKDRLLAKYHLGIFDLCSQYDNIYSMLEKDMNSVKTELLSIFRVP